MKSTNKRGISVLFFYNTNIIYYYIINNITCIINECKNIEYSIQEIENK